MANIVLPIFIYKFFIFREDRYKIGLIGAKVYMIWVELYHYKLNELHKKGKNLMVTRAVAVALLHGKSEST